MTESSLSGVSFRTTRTGQGPGSSALLRVALSAGRMAGWQLDLQHEIVSIDETVAGLFGVPALPREIPIGLIDALIAPEDLPAVKEAREAALDGRPVVAEFRIRHGDGSCRWLRVLGETQSDGKSPTHIVGVIYDITRRKDAESKRSESEQYLRDVLSAIDEGFCICDMLTDAEGNPVDYRFVEVNSHFEAMTGLIDPVGKRAQELVLGLEHHWIEAYARVGIGRESLRVEMPSDAMGRWFNLCATPLAAPGRFAIVFRDVSERKLGELALVGSEAESRMSTGAMKLGRERQQLLLEEMDHRMKNILSLAQALSIQTFGGGSGGGGVGY